MSLFNKYLPNLLMAIAALAAIAIFYVYNPAQEIFFWSCTFKQITGYQCPGCGGQRAVHALLHGNFQEAFRLNALFVSSIPFVMYFFWKNPVLKPSAWWVIGGVIVIFWVGRNV